MGTESTTGLESAIIDPHFREWIKFLALLVSSDYSLTCASGHVMGGQFKGWARETRCVMWPVNWVSSGLERSFPKLRLFLRSDRDTKFVSLSPLTQAAGWAGCGLLVCWTVIATAIVLTDMLVSGSLRDQALRDQELYEGRIDYLTNERDRRSVEAQEMRERLNAAQERILALHSALLESEDRRRELETGIESSQATLRRTLKDSELGVSALTSEGGLDADGADPAVDAVSLALLASALKRATDDRDSLGEEAAEARHAADTARHDVRLLQQKTDRIFSQLEEAVSISIEPLDQAFRSVGLSSDTILDTVRRGYSGRGGPITPIGLSNLEAQPDPETLRAMGILDTLDQLNLSRLALEEVPFTMPIKGNYRFTSGFGPRWGGVHRGLDFAAEYGKPIHSTANGVVTFAGWQGDYGRIVKIRHRFGLETRYAHLAKIRVSKGQRVSHGERIGDMGNSGRSTGTHLHYEILVNGKAINPMIYIRASRNVF